MKAQKIKRMQTPTTQKLKRKSSPSKATFVDHLNQSDEKLSGVTEVVEGTSITNVNSVLSVQEIENDGSGRRTKVIEWGENILDNLDAIRHGLLTGGIPNHQLQNLSQLLRRQKANTLDPKLKEIIDEIELRASVELAKLTRRKI